MALFTKEEALDYHSKGRKGKVEVVPVKPCKSQKHLSLAYSPGVAQPCLAIAKDPSLAYEYTAKGNLVAVVSNGTAVLGLGNIGALAGKPVMEGKGVLFKMFADIDVYDINIGTEDPDKLIECVKLLEPTFGGINLEDIKAPECFRIEEELKAQMNIPVFHDDQHGTAIISGAGIINALAITGKRIEDLKVVVSGAGAGATACTKFYIGMGVRRENVFMFDSRGLIHQGREKLTPQKRYFAQDKDYGTLAEVIRGADMFLGLSTKDVLTQDMVRSMADHPIIFACANPDPEITYEDAKAARPDCIMGTGRSDFPNQINNVLGFPSIFRGALDTRATAINEDMKLAAANALAALAKEPVSEDINALYGRTLSFGPDYIIPSPFDPRVLEWVASAVAKAAMDSGVATVQLDLDAYRESLRARLAGVKERIALVVDYYGLDF
ncbi:malate dehydrogenase (oxaloacetate-decarboxylating)(NADP+) [Desulfobaculum xiamenense]|uniref:Malate dehydrogenase (Oxaloacetate-decarboxylating)(NADP+) n=1 Tax=Desulfobaculum xiamenense TaxID=995050 RepID=A0A846QMI2_9BACT|nr:malic enzyme-like NAD(P)-binding protein [Desulfobaculum xiamenense]NJB69348.1 malate dehydrogenase (oxaloacetate-decarboxylating)(NADP+) [Desulfobaculum xiamenense]